METPSDARSKSSAALLQRREIKDLASWANQSKRKPLILRGARQVGKSTLARQLAENGGLDILEVNFERNPSHRQAFVSNDPRKILTALQLLTGKSAHAQSTL